MEITEAKIQALAQLYSQPSRYCYELRRIGARMITDARRRQVLKFIPTPLYFLGIKVPDLKKFAKATVKLCKDDEKASFDLLRGLWSDGTREGRQIAAEILGGLSVKYPKPCFEFIQARFQHIGDWEICDRLACVSMRKLLKNDFKKFGPLILVWMQDQNLWVRRFGTVCLVALSLNRQKVEKYILKNIELVMADREYYVKKAAGWVLREYTKRYDSKAAFNFMKKYAKSGNKDTIWIIKGGSEKLGKAEREKLLKLLDN